MVVVLLARGVDVARGKYKMLNSHCMWHLIGGIALFLLVAVSGGIAMSAVVDWLPNSAAGAIVIVSLFMGCFFGAAAAVNIICNGVFQIQHKAKLKRRKRDRKQE